ncbi:hypothetical protein [Variovorax sp. DAIF25]|uniref:hypothetical protein n=1 Tax=Variovorax sp. DAIF25 TaxID=3080983 RepID=UPI003D6B4B75
MDGTAAALADFETARIERASQVQLSSLGNNWLREGGNVDWVYAYDAWAVPLGVPASSSPAADRPTTRPVARGAGRGN